MGRTVVYYFSGTGNTLFVAKKLKEQVPDIEILPIVSANKNGAFDVNAHAVGFIFPIYMMGLPLPVYEFIKMAKLYNASYIFAIATRMGTSHAAFNTISKLLRNKKKQLSAHFNITMPNNDSKFTNTAPSKDEIEELENNAIKQFKDIANTISNNQIQLEEDIGATSKIPKFLVNMLGALGRKFDNKLHADDKCIGCGTCEKVCPSGKVKLVDKKPEWDKKTMCFKCSACIAYCPVQASQITKFTEGKERYSHPYATAHDIAMQKDTAQSF